MYKKPPEDDEPREYPEFTYPARRRRQAITPKPPPVHHRTGEHPEVPKVRRASLYYYKSQTRRPSRPALGGEKDEQDTDAKASRREVTPTRRPSSPATPSSSARRSQHTHTRTRTRPVRSRRPFSASLQQLSRNPAVMIIAAIALIILIIAPIITYFGRSHATVPARASSSTSTNQQTPVVREAPANARELIIVPQDTDHPPPPVFATSAYLLDADTGETLYAYNPFTHLPMLSTTKLMTASLAVEQGNLDQRITITAAMWRDIGQLSADSALFGVKQGETYTLRDLLYGLLFVSGNDAAIAIADALGGNLQNFVAEMNQKARQLGMYDTHFMNPHGLLEAGQYSSAHDLALLGSYSMSLPVLHKISGEMTAHIPQGGNHPERFLTNENQFMWWYPGVDGGKTGYDNQSDFIQIISCTRNHHHLIGVVMHSKNWWTDMRDLMNWGFDSFTWISPRDVDANQHPIIYDYLWNYFASDTQDSTIPTADHGHYYIYTGFTISGPIMAYFDKNGGLKTFGYPTKMPVVSSVPVISQQFEHGTIQCVLTTNRCQKI
jgi:D-alanyl-D-alanine carboxypeptidase